jgi:pSer/pThr/pTyr-binding forkhead associated (FHA) protein
MPYLKLQDRQYPLTAGETTIGAFEGAMIRLPSGDPANTAVVLSGASGVSIRRGSLESVVTVNGVQLGVEPSPLLHGDRVEIAGHELRLGEDQKGGNTSFVSAAEIAKLVGAKASTPPKKPTTATGGRLVSLVDGREYPVPDAGMSFGREVGNDVVIASNEISRKHASIAPDATGYVLTDHSTNGVWVNGSRVAERQTLGRGDVIKMGAEEFRFYADVAKTAPAAAAPAAAAPPPPENAALAETMLGRPGTAVPKAAPPAAAAPAAAAAAAAAAVPAAVPAAAPAAVPSPATPPPRASTRMALATLEVIAEGPLKGTTFELHSALTNIGRGDHNDITIKDESISDSHAKLQKRADGWYVVDQESTNGTYVGGRRVQGEVRIEGAPDLRIGGIKMTFRPAAVAVADGAGTRAIAAVNTDTLKKSGTAKPVTSAAKSKSRMQLPEPTPPKKGCAGVIALFVAIAGATAGLLGLFLLVGR